MIDTTPLDEALVTLRSLLAWLHEPHAEVQLARCIAGLEAWRTELRRTDMEMIPVESSNVESVRYNETTCTLWVTFKGGGLYAYAAVPATVHAALMGSASKGTFLALSIKPHYAATKVLKMSTSSPDTPEEQAALAEQREGISDALTEMGDESQEYYSLAEEPR